MDSNELLFLTQNYLNFRKKYWNQILVWVACIGNDLESDPKTLSTKI